MEAQESDCECAQYAALLRLALALILLRCPHVTVPEATRVELRENLDCSVEEVGELVTRL